MDPVTGAIVAVVEAWGPVMTDIFVKRRRSRVQIEDLEQGIQQILNQNVELRVSALVAERRIQFIEMLIGQLVTSNLFRLQAGQLELIGSDREPVRGVIEQTQAWGRAMVIDQARVTQEHKTRDQPTPSRVTREPLTSPSSNDGERSDPETPNEKKQSLYEIVIEGIDKDIEQRRQDIERRRRHAR